MAAIQGVDCPKCSRGANKIKTARKTVPAGTTLVTGDVLPFLVNHTCEIDYCLRCRGWYPVELKGVRL